MQCHSQTWCGSKMGNTIPRYILSQVQIKPERKKEKREGGEKSGREEGRKEVISVYQQSNQSHQYWIYFISYYQLWRSSFPVINYTIGHKYNITIHEVNSYVILGALQDYDFFKKVFFLHSTKDRRINRAHLYQWEDRNTNYNQE